MTCTEPKPTETSQQNHKEYELPDPFRALMQTSKFKTLTSTIMRFSDYGARKTLHILMKNGETTYCGKKILLTREEILGAHWRPA